MRNQKSNNRLAVIHYLPLEYYPPITNFLYTLFNDKITSFNKVDIYTCFNINQREPFKLPNPIYIHRNSFPSGKDRIITRLYKYINFNLATLFGLIINYPNKLLYYESYSAWPAYIYAHYFNRKCQILIHNHEYSGKDWYESTMKQVRYYHHLEKKWLYKRAVWISQTNKDRLDFFHKDHPYINSEVLQEMPNYPPISWKNQINQQTIHKDTNSKPIKLVYVGSLSFQSTYIKELCGWIISLNGKITLDIYAYNLYEDVKDYLTNINSPFINYYEEGIEYNDQPKILSQYDIGLILYKAHNQNYTYNAPNKLFEYLACNLDVWYPDVLMGPKPYNTNITFPIVIPVNFEKINQFNWQKAIDKEGLEYKPSKYYCEKIYKQLIDKILLS